jgi:hypothetical protein
MRDEMKAIKLGSRVVYAVGDVEYSAIALAPAGEGYSQGLRLSSIFLNLIYLNEFGVPVKIIGAPLLGVAADEDHVKEVAQKAAEKTLGYTSSNLEGRSAIYDAQVDHIKANPRTVGWKPYVEADEVAKLLAHVQELETQNNTLIAKAAPAKDDGGGAGATPVESFLKLLTHPEVAAFAVAPENQDAIQEAFKKGGYEEVDPDDTDDSQAYGVGHPARFAADAGDLVGVPDSSEDPYKGAAPEEPDPAAEAGTEALKAEQAEQAAEAGTESTASQESESTAADATEQGEKGETSTEE